MAAKFIEKRIYHLEFLDHCSGEHKKCYHQVLGMLVRQDDEYLYLTPWWWDTDNKEDFNENMEKYTVLKSTIKRKRTVKPFAKRK